MIVRANRPIRCSEKSQVLAFQKKPGLLFLPNELSWVDPGIPVRSSEYNWQKKLWQRLSPLFYRGGSNGYEEGSFFSFLSTGTISCNHYAREYEFGILKRKKQEKYFSCFLIRFHEMLQLVGPLSSFHIFSYKYTFSRRDFICMLNVLCPENIIYRTLCQKFKLSK